MNKLLSCILILSLLFGLPGCSLARAELLDAPRPDRLCGVWVVLNDEKSAIDLEDGFMEKDAIVLWYTEEGEGEALSISTESQGNIVRSGNIVSGSDESQNVSVEGTVYLKPNSYILGKLIGLYRRPDESIFAADGEAWMELSNGGNITFSEEWNATWNGNSIRRGVDFKINFELLDPLNSLELIYFKEDYSILERERLNLDALSNGTAAVAVPPGCGTLLIEETRISEEGGKKITTYRRQDGEASDSVWEDEKTVLHPYVLQGEGLTAQPFDLKIFWDRDL